MLVASADFDGFGRFQFIGVVVHDHVDALSVEFPAEGCAFVGVSPVGDDFVDSRSDLFRLCDEVQSDGSGVCGSRCQDHGEDESWSGVLESEAVGVACPLFCSWDCGGQVKVVSEEDAGLFPGGSGFVSETGVTVMAADDPPVG